MTLGDIIALIAILLSVAGMSASGAWALSRLWNKIEGRFGNIDARLDALELRLSDRKPWSRDAKVRDLQLRM